MDTEIATEKDFSKIEQVLFTGDLASLSPQDRVSYVTKVCESIGLNPLTKPFEYIRLNGKLTLYAKKDATDQLRKIYNIAITKVDVTINEGMFMVQAFASTPDGRTDCDIGVVPIKGLVGDRLANTMMKAHTKAKRRVTLSICGLGLLDESEVKSIAGANVWKEAELVEEEAALCTPEQREELNELLTMDLIEEKIWRAWIHRAGVEKFEEMTEKQMRGCLRVLNKKKAEYTQYRIEETLSGKSSQEEPDESDN